MNKRNVRSFAYGILFAVVVLGGSYLWFDKETTSITVKEAKEMVEKEGLILLSQEEYDELMAKPPEEQKEEQSEELTENLDEEAEREEATDDKSEKEEQQDIEEEEEEVIEYQLVIQSGMNTKEIAEILERENIITDGYEFEQYLIAHDYNRRVQVGTFDLTNEMDYEEIGSIITKS